MSLIHYLLSVLKLVGLTSFPEVIDTISILLYVECTFHLLPVLSIYRYYKKTPVGKGIQENKMKTTGEKCNVNVSESSTNATGNFDILILINTTLPFVKGHIMVGLMFDKMEA